MRISRPSLSIIAVTILAASCATSASPGWDESVTTFALAPEVRVQINSPSARALDRNKKTILILYTLPNGSTIEQTVGHKPKPGEDWHFDIQHIGAQTRFLRHLLPDRNIIVAYLEADASTIAHSWPAWRKKNGDTGIPGIIDATRKNCPAAPDEIVLSSHSGGGSFIFGCLNAVTNIPADITRIAFLDSDYAYDPALGHAAKLRRWLEASPRNHLCVLAYDDAAARLNGKPFVSAAGGTWGKSHAMLKDFETWGKFNSETNGTLERFSALDGRIVFLLKENPERKIYHTIQVERNGFIEAMVSGTTNEGNGFQYFGERAYGQWIDGH